MALTFEDDLNRVVVNHHAKYIGQRSFRLKVIVRTERHTHTQQIHHYIWPLK